MRLGLKTRVFRDVSSNAGVERLSPGHRPTYPALLRCSSRVAPQSVLDVPEVLLAAVAQCSRAACCLLAALRSCVAHGEDWAEPPCTGRRSSTVDGWLVADKNSLTTQQVSWRGAVRREPSGPPQVVVLLSCRTRRSISIASPKITYIF